MSVVEQMYEWNVLRSWCDLKSLKEVISGQIGQYKWVRKYITENKCIQKGGAFQKKFTEFSLRIQ